MELKDTIKLMQSDDFKDRFKAEYYQLKIRYEKLCNICCKYADGTINFFPKSSYEILIIQCEHMRNYMITLENRAKVEGIEL